MATKLKLDGVEYALEPDNKKGQSLYAALQFSQSRFEELSNMLAVLTKAKRAYLEELKQEILLKRGGLL